MGNRLISSDRTVIAITGDDRRSFLQGLISQDIDLLTGARAIFTTLLTPQGKILFDFFVVEYGDAFLIDCNAASAPALLKRLMLYRLRTKITIELEESLGAVLTTEQPSDGTAFRDPRHQALGWRAIVKDCDGAKNGAKGDDDLRRIALGVPELGKDFDSDEMFLLDVNYDALYGVSYSKGCFVGQEVTSRMKRKGEVRRRTLIAGFDGSPPAKGAPVTAGETTLGHMMSGVSGRALALIRIDRWEKTKAKNLSPQCEGRALQLKLPDYLERG